MRPALLLALGCQAAHGSWTAGQAVRCHAYYRANEAAWRNCKGLDAGACTQVQLPHSARSLIERLLCNVEDRLGSRGGAAEVKVGT